MKYMVYISMALFLGCSGVQTEVVQTHPSDSLIEIVKKHNDSSILIHKKSDEKTLKIIDEVLFKMDSLTTSHKMLKEKYSKIDTVHKLIQKVVVRDTIYITEKKNFWGKTKKSIDSTKHEEADTTQQYK